jgi:hypothetical protein
LIANYAALLSLLIPTFSKSRQLKRKLTVNSSRAILETTGQTDKSIFLYAHDA